MTTIFKLALSAVVAAGLAAAAPSRADDMKGPDAVYADVQKSLGSVPGFVKMLPKSAHAGLWQQEKDLELSDKTALAPKTKALISLAVASQIPCQYCIWADTQTAK